MNRLLTTLLVWLLMAALPLHAVAASINLSCAPSQQHMGTATADHAQHTAAADPHAHHEGHASDATDAPADSSGAAQDEASELSHSSCSACSAFCIGAVAPPSSSLSLPSFDGAETLVAAPADFGTGFIPDGLQRPPRQ
jgi:aldehyde:ferredoxin oxidoreductase